MFISLVSNKIFDPAAIVDKRRNLARRYGVAIKKSLTEITTMPGPESCASSQI